MRNKKIIENLLIEDYAAEGKSIGRVEGKVIFVQDAVPGDVVTVRLTKNKKDWGEGKIIAVEQYSPQRVEPFCSHFGVCGGCRWQMLPYEKQLVYKHEQVVGQVKHMTKCNSLPEILPIVGADENILYRNKLEYTFSNKKFFTSEELQNIKNLNLTIPLNKLNAVGFHPKGFFDKVVEIEKCYLQKEPTNALRNFIRDYAKQHNLSFYDIRQHTGFLRTMQVRICITGEWFANIVVAEDDMYQIKPLMDAVLEKFPNITTLFYTINKKWNDSMQDLQPVVYAGKGFVIEQLEKFSFKISPKSFFQTNTAQTLKLYGLVKEFAQLNGEEIIYDLYCGTGSIGIFLSDNAKKIIGVELVQEAIDDAIENAKLNNLQNTSFHCGDVVKICDDNFFKQHGFPDAIIVDPPRAGLHQTLVDKLLEIAALKIVYVSCNPATLCRDLDLLSEKYTIKKLQAVDMFPHTHHIETVSLLERK